MRRALATAIAVAAAVAAPAQAAPVKVGTGVPYALAAGGATAFVVTDSGSTSRPYMLARVSGRTAKRIGAFGSRRTEFPDVAADATGRAVVSWEQPVSGGVTIFGQVVGADRLGAAGALVTGTGPGRLALATDGAALVAYPDETGDTEVSRTPGVARPQRGAVGPYDLPARTRLSADAPVVRHLPLAVALTPAGALVLDLVQRSSSSELRVEGPGAPTKAIVRVSGLHQVEAAFAADASTIAVAYVRGGRVVLATASGTGWRARTLAGPTAKAPVTSAPAVTLNSDGEPVVAYAQRAAADAPRDVYLATGSSRRRLTKTAADEADVFAAGAFLAWSRRERSGRVTLVERIP